MLGTKEIEGIQLILSYIMVYSFGMKYHVSDKARDRASIVWIVTLILIFLLDAI